MSMTAMKLALEALDRNWDGCVNSPEGEAITALNAAIEAAKKQEPVATVRTWHKNGDQHAELGNWELGLFKLPDGEHTLYTASPAAQRPLVWLSEEDEREIKDRCTTVACVLRAVKAKLKGKNT
jgi:hypothetical protein